MPLLQIYRAGSLFTEVSTGGSDTMFNGSLGGMNKITSKFESQQPIKFKKRDYIYHHGHSYFLNRIPKHTKDGKHTYEAVFVGREYTLYNFALRYLNSATFPLYGTASEHLEMILGVANIAEAGWTGTAAATISILINYDKDSCRTGIQKVAEAFKLELTFSDQSLALNARNTGRVHDLTFTYGMDNGLYSMTKTELEESEFGTRFYGYGGSENLPQNYKGGALQLIPPTIYVDRRISTYGLIEKHVEFPEIFPERTGTVSATSAINEVTDSTLDFDLNDVIVDGSASIVFTTGLLRGQEFEIAFYKDASKLIKFNINKDEAGGQLPSSTLKPAIGDQYKLIGIVLPQSYITNAENRVQTALNLHADANQDPPFEFGLEIDPIFLAELNYQYEINPGDMVQAVEPDMDVSVYLRITEISYPVFEPFRITATIGDKINYSLSVEVIKDITSTKQVVKQITKTSLELQRINSIRRRELQGAIFDTDNYFDTANIKPGSIETSMLAVGIRSQDFSLSVMFKPNYNANPNSISWSAGQLVHFTIADVNKTWDIAPTIKSDLVSTTLYYIYAKCAKNGSVGVIVLDPIQRRFNDDPTDYYFLVGIAHTVSNGVRAVSLTYGFTDINGRFITTGRITSADGLTWFDLDTGEISGVIKFRASNGSIQNVTTIATAAQNAVDVSANADAKAITANVTANAANTAAIAAQGKADTAFTNAANAQSAATNAQSAANTANNLLAEIANDNLLTPAEKQQVLKEIQIIQGESFYLLSQATTYAVTTTGYETNFNNLNTYVTGLLVSMTTNSTIDGPTFRASFKAYYDTKQALLRSIAEKAKQIADAAQTSANTVATNLSNLLGSLGALAYQQLVYNAMELETIIVGGFLKTSLINANQIIVGNNLETLGGSQAKANAAQTAAINAAAANTAAAIAGIQVGARNVLKNSNFFQGSAGWGANGGAQIFPLNSNGSTGLRVMTQLVNEGIFSTDLWAIPLKQNQDYIISFDITGLYYNALVLNVGFSSKTEPLQVPNSTEKVRLSIVVRTGINAPPNDAILILNATDTRMEFILTNIKVEEGTVASPWTPAPEDLAADATAKANAAQAAAQAYADAKDILKEITTKAYADGIVDAEEQARINQAQANLDAAKLDASNKAEAAKLAAIGAAAVDAALKSQEALVAAQNFASAQDSLKAIEVKAYADGIVDAEEARAIADANAKLNEAKADATFKAQVAAAGRNYAAGRMLYRDPTFLEGANGIFTYNNDTANGNVYHERVPKSAVAGMPTDFGLYIRGSGTPSPGMGGFTFSTQSRPNAVFVTRIVATIPVGFSLEYGSNATGDNTVASWSTPHIGTGKFEEYIFIVKCGATGGFSTTNFFFLDGPRQTVEWALSYATVFDLTDAEVNYLKDYTAKVEAALVSANTFAEQVAISKANIAQGSAISAASTDAQNKANIAYSNAVSASNTYAETVANQASTAVQIAAAADASNKATAAYNNAVSAAQTQYSNLTAALKPLAFSDIQQIGAQSGITFINNGNIATFSIDAAYIRANVITADYLKANVITADYISSLNIVATNIEAVTGKIGTWVIDSTGMSDTTGSAKILASVAGSIGKTEVQIGLHLTSGPFVETTIGARRYAARFYATNGDGNKFNTAIYAQARDTEFDYAIQAVGGVDIQGHTYTRSLNVGTGGLFSQGSAGINGRIVFKGAGGFDWHFVFRNGIPIEVGSGQ